MNGLINGDGASKISGAIGLARQDYEAVKQQAQGNLSQRPAVTRQDLIDMSLKLQEALSLITQALTRMS